MDDFTVTLLDEDFEVLELQEDFEIILPEGSEFNITFSSVGINGRPGTDGINGVDGEGVIPGGATGQVLRKASNADFDTEWFTVSGTGDVIGPASSVDDRIVTFDGITGKVIQDGGSTIANVLARANHTGTQLATTISDFDEAVDDRIVTLVLNSASITWAYDDVLNTLTASVTAEFVQDTVGAFFGDSSTVDVTYNDAGNALSAAVIADSIDNTFLSNMAQSTIKGRAAAAGTGDPTDLTAAQVKTILALVSTDISDFTEAVQDVVGAFATDTATIDFVYTDGSNTLEANVKTDSIDNTLLANMATARFKGRVTASTGDPEDLTGTQATTLLDVFTSTLKGLAPSSGGGTTNFLRADGAWAAPSGGGGGSGDVVGPASAVDSRIAAFDGTTGKLIKDGGSTIADVLARANHTGSQTASTISDFTEAVQDVAGAFATDTATIDFVYTDASNILEANVKADSIDNTFLANMAQSTIKGRAAAAGTGDPTDLTAAQVKTILAIVSTDISDFTEAVQDVVGAFFTDGTTIDFTYNDAGNSITAEVINDTITDAKLRNSAALSVIGRSANSTGDPADIAAGTDAHVLRRSGTALGFGVIGIASLGGDITAAGTALLDDADAAAQRTTLGVGDWGKAPNYTMTDKGTVTSGTVTFARSATLYQRLQVGGALTIATSGWPASGTFGDLLLEIVNGSAFTITWPTLSWVKSDGTTQSTPTRTLQASGTDFVVMWSRDGGTTVYARFV